MRTFILKSGAQQNNISNKGVEKARAKFNFFFQKWGEGVRPICDFWLTFGGGGVWTPPFLNM